MTLFSLIAVAVAVVQAAAQQVAPPELTALVAKAKLGAPVAWCQGEFQAGRRGAFAVALKASTGGSSYAVLGLDGSLVTLATFTGGVDLACYTKAQADALNATIGRSATIHGQLTPRWNTAVVCGFVDDTTAVCWQYSPAERAFVRIGGWQT